MTDIIKPKIIEIQLNFAGESLSIKAPESNKAFIEIAASQINDKLDKVKQHHPNSDYDKLVLMVCLQFAFRQTVLHGEIDNMLGLLKEMYSDVASLERSLQGDLDQQKKQVLNGDADVGYEKIQDVGHSLAKDEKTGAEYGRQFSKP